MADLSYLDGLILEYLLYTHEEWLARASKPGFQSKEEAADKLREMTQLLERSGAMPTEKSEGNGKIPGP